MNILIVGGYSVFVSQLIEKFNKERWEVYQLTGSKHPTRRHPYVVEQYDFPYDTDSIKEILDSAAPDLVLFTGAYDVNLSRGKTRQESMYYMSSLVNLLMASQMLNIPKFVYISSHEVYEESYPEMISEDQATSPASTKGMLVAQGEDLVIRYSQTMDMDTYVLRLDHLYWLPKNRKEVEEIHARMCLEALRNQKVPASEKHIFSSVYIADAVYAIFEILKKEDHEHSIYQITASEEENEIEIAALTIPKSKAVEVADILVENGIRAIWNFAHTDLDLPEDVIVESVHLSDSLMTLSYNVSQRMEGIAE